MQYIPNADKPAVDKLLQPFVVLSRDEVGQEIHSSFDGLGRPICVKDQNEVQLVLGWDGLSRLTERRLSHGTKKDINHSLLGYNDDQCQMTTTNVLTGAITVTTADFFKRPISLTSPDETKLVYNYDQGGQYSKGLLMSVTSESTGVAHHYDYDIHGHLTKDALFIDGQTFTTLYRWSPLGQLLGVTNADGTSLSRVLCKDGKSVSRIDLKDSEDALQAHVTLTHYEDVFGRPLVCDFGNGLSSLSTVHDNGAIASITLSNKSPLMSANSPAVHRQAWSLDSAHQISSYDRELHGVKSGSFTFQYDASGTLHWTV
jgi:YD repeat-containing protein